MVVNSFTVNGTNSSFQNTNSNYYNVLNGGQVQENTLQYTFTLTELQGHVIDYIIIESLLFNSDGTLSTSKNLQVGLSKDGNNYSTYSGTIISSEDSPNPFSIKFTDSTGTTESNQIQLVLTVSGNESCYYGLKGIIVSLKDVLQDIKYTFSGPLYGRSVNKITSASIVVNKGVESVTFSKDPLNNYDQTRDNVEGRMYLKQNGIFVDGYQYGVNAVATNSQVGIVKLSNSSFDIENDAIVPPSEAGVAATPQLVYNALATAKQYVDDSVSIVNIKVDGIQATLDGIDAPLIMGIELDDDSVISMGDTLTFSKDFKNEDNKLYINWLELI